MKKTTRRKIRWHRSKMCRDVLFTYGPNGVRQACAVGLVLLANGVPWEDRVELRPSDRKILRRVLPDWENVIDALDRYVDTGKVQALLRQAGYDLEIIDDINGG